MTIAEPWTPEELAEQTTSLWECSICGHCPDNPIVCQNGHVRPEARWKATLEDVERHHRAAESAWKKSFDSFRAGFEKELQDLQMRQDSSLRELQEASRQEQIITAQRRALLLQTLEGIAKVLDAAACSVCPVPNAYDAWLDVTGLIKQLKQ